MSQATRIIESTPEMLNSFVKEMGGGDFECITGVNQSHNFYTANKIALRNAKKHSDRNAIAILEETITSGKGGRIVKSYYPLLFVPSKKGN